MLLTIYRISPPIQPEKTCISWSVISLLNKKTISLFQIQYLWFFFFTSSQKYNFDNAHESLFCNPSAESSTVFCSRRLWALISGAENTRSVLKRLHLLQSGRPEDPPFFDHSGSPSNCKITKEKYLTTWAISAWSWEL